MKRNRVLTITSLLSILLLSFHLTQDALRAPQGSWDAGPGNLIVIAILLVYLCGTVLLAGRRSGAVIMLLGSLFAAGMPVLHMTGRFFNPAKHSSPFLFVWTLIALGVLGLFSFILAAHAVWRPHGDLLAPRSGA